MTKQNTTYPKHYLNPGFTVLILAFFFLAAAALFPKGQQPPLEPLIISNLSCLQPGSDVIITFNLPMAPENKLNSSPFPEVIFSPQQKGSLKWRSSTELVFTPAAGSLPGGQYVSISIAKAFPLAGKEYAPKSSLEWSFWVPYLQVAGKVANWPIVIGQPRLMGLLNWRSNQVGRGPLFLLYDQPIDIEKIKSHLEVKNEKNQPLPFQLFRPQNAKPVSESNIDPRWLAAIIIKSLPNDGQKVKIAVPDWMDGKLDFMDFSLTVNTSFQLIEQSPGNPRSDGLVRLKSSRFLKFNNPIELSHFKDSLQILPLPKSIDVSGSWYNQVQLNLGLNPGTDYRLTFKKTFKDVLGNPLAKPVEIKFRSEDLPPVLAVPVAPVLLEKDSRRLPIQIRNVQSIEASIFRIHSPADFAKALAAGRKKSHQDYGLDQPGTKIQIPLPKVSPNETLTMDFPLEVEPGSMCIEVTAVGSGSEACGKIQNAVLVQITDLDIAAKILENKVFAWVSHLHDASPVPGAAVSLVNDGGNTIGRATADRFGVARFNDVQLASGAGLLSPISLVAESGKDAVVCRLVNDELAQPWQFALKGKVLGSAELPAAVFTERGVYRPGESVHLKLMIGSMNFLPGQDRRVDLQIQDPRGQQVLKEKISLDRFGCADKDIPLKEQAPVGVYQVQVTQESELNKSFSGVQAPRHGGTEAKLMRSFGKVQGTLLQKGSLVAEGTKKIVSYKFRVEEYRVPTFKVTVNSDEKTWKRGAGIEAVIRADYLHGGSLDGRDLRWVVQRRPQPFAPPAFPKYLFSLEEANNLIGSIASGETKLDGQGKAAVHFKAEHPSTAGPMLYELDASVTDVDRQTYAGRLSRLIHPAAFYIGVLPPTRQVFGAGETLRVPIAAVSPDGKPVPGVKVEVRLERIDHHTTARMSEDSSVQMLNRPVPVRLAESRLTTGKTPVTCEFKLPAAGMYRVCAGAEDPQHQEVQAGFQLAVSGDNPTAWPRFDQDRIDVIADKPSYKPGDTARLVVQTPFKKARGLLTIEQDDILDYRVFEIKDNTPTLTVPITAAYAPNVYVSVILLRGREHFKKDASGFETGAPGFKIGYANLAVEPVDRRLSVKVNPAYKKISPGEKLKVDFQVRDSKGKPASGQATVMVVDEAVLGLTAYQTPDPEKSIYAEQPLGVRTGSGRLDLPHARRARYERIFPAGDGMKDTLFSDFPMQLRKLFMSTAYWNPKVPVGADGKASIEFKLPDNLTTYRIMAVVTDENSRVGSAQDQVLVRKPLMIQPVLPRFLYPGDTLQVEALVFNGTDAPGEIKLDSRFNGIELTGGAASLTAPVKPGDSHSFKFPVRVTGNKEAIFRFAAVLAGHTTDAVEVKLPILSPGNQRSLAVSKAITDTGTVTVTLPTSRIPGSTKMEVVVSSTVLSELKDSVQYLMHYPNGCIEQTTSTAYPLVVLQDLLPEIGIEVNQADLKKFSEAGIRRILSFQTPSGGLSYWPGSTEPHAFATAFGLTALIEAKKKGYDIPDKALAGMADYLEQALRKGQITESIPHGNIADADTRALFVMTLGRLGRPQPGYVSVLWRSKDKLSPFGLAFLAIAVKEMPGDHSLLQPILAEIRKAAEEEEKEAYFTGKAKGGWSFDSPLRTQGSALIAYATAIDATDANKTGEMSAKLLTGLLKRRQYGLWGNTQENVFGIMGVHSIATRQEGKGPSSQFDLNFNGKRYLPSEMEELSKRVRRLTLQDSDLHLQKDKEETRSISLRSNSNVPLHLTVRAQYDVPLDPQNRAPQSNGFTITRQYETLKGDSLEGKVIPLGSLVRVRVHVKTNNEHHYTAIDDKLPAGLEPLNTNLETTERVAPGTFDTITQRSLSVLSYSEIRDHRAAFYVDEMLPGEYEYTYIARATTPGTFLRPAGRAEAMYQPDIFGTTNIDEVTIK